MNPHLHAYDELSSPKGEVLATSAQHIKFSTRAARLKFFAPLFFKKVAKEARAYLHWPLP